MPMPTSMYMHSALRISMLISKWKEANDLLKYYAAVLHPWGKPEKGVWTALWRTLAKGKFEGG